MSEHDVSSSFGYTVVASHDMVTWPYAFAAGGYFGNQPALGNSGDAVVLLNAGGVIDETAAWGAGAQSGRAWRLDPSTWRFRPFPVDSLSCYNEGMGA